jgi:hypothetical protein
MNVDVFTLCDFAKAEHDRMTIVGTFNRTNARQASHRDEERLNNAMAESDNGVSKLSND